MHPGTMPAPRRADDRHPVDVPSGQARVVMPAQSERPPAEEEEEAVQGTKSPAPYTGPPRINCRYARSSWGGCWQTNPRHRNTFAHPGDPDWKSTPEGQGWKETHRNSPEHGRRQGVRSPQRPRRGRSPEKPKSSGRGRKSRSRSRKQDRRRRSSSSKRPPKERTSRSRRKKQRRSPSKKRKSRSRTRKKEARRKSPSPDKKRKSREREESEKQDESGASPENGRGRKPRSKSGGLNREAERSKTRKDDGRRQPGRSDPGQPSATQASFTSPPTSQKRRSPSKNDESDAQSGSRTRLLRLKYKDLGVYTDPTKGEGVKGNWDAMRYVIYLVRTNAEELWHPHCDPIRHNLAKGDFNVAGNEWYGREIKRWDGPNKNDRKESVAELEAAIQLVMVHLGSAALRRIEIRALARERAGSPTAGDDETTGPEEKKKRKDLANLEKQARAAQRRAVTARALFERVCRASLYHSKGKKGEFPELITHMLPIHPAIRITTIKDTFAKLGWSMNVYRRRCSQRTIVPRGFPVRAFDPYKWQNSDSDES